MNPGFKCFARGLSAVAFALSALGSAQAGFVTTNEAGLDAIYGQASFGTHPIDIRFLAPLTIISSLATINTDDDFNNLGAMGVADPTIVSLFFVDAINFCGVALDGIVGCAGVPGHFITVDSNFVAPGSNYGGGPLFNGPQNDIGHELGHNLGLNHNETDGNLLNASVQTQFGFLLNGAGGSENQVATILASDLIHTDLNGALFIEIQPYAVVAPALTAVPEPDMLALLGLGLAAIALRKRKSVKR